MLAQRSRRSSRERAQEFIQKALQYPDALVQVRAAEVLLDVFQDACGFDELATCLRLNPDAEPIQGDSSPKGSGESKEDVIREGLAVLERYMPPDFVFPDGVSQYETPSVENIEKLQRDLQLWLKASAGKVRMGPEGYLIFGSD